MSQRPSYFPFHFWSLLLYMCDILVVYNDARVTGLGEVLGQRSNYSLSKLVIAYGTQSLT